MFFSKFVCEDDGKPGIGLKREDIISIISVLRSVKRSKDALDTNMSKVQYPFPLLSLCSDDVQLLLKLMEGHILPNIFTSG